MEKRCYECLQSHGGIMKRYPSSWPHCESTSCAEMLLDGSEMSGLVSPDATGHLDGAIMPDTPRYSTLRRRLSTEWTLPSTFLLFKVSSRLMRSFDVDIRLSHMMRVSSSVNFFVLSCAEINGVPGRRNK